MFTYFPFHSKGVSFNIQVSTDYISRLLELKKGSNPCVQQALTIEGDKFPCITYEKEGNILRIIPLVNVRKCKVCSVQKYRN